MFLKQYNYKPRTNSQSSGTPDQSTSTSAVQEPSTTKPQENVSAAIAGRRRSSTTEKFSGLQNYKRSSMDNADRQAFHDQNTAQPGIMGQMWQNFTKGTK